MFHSCSLQGPNNSFFRTVNIWPVEWGTISPSDTAVLTGSTWPCHRGRDTMVWHHLLFSATSHPLPIPFIDTDLKPQTVLPGYLFWSTPENTVYASVFIMSFNNTRQHGEHQDWTCSSATGHAIKLMATCLLETEMLLPPLLLNNPSSCIIIQSCYSSSPH